MVIKSGRTKYLAVGSNEVSFVTFGYHILLPLSRLSTFPFKKKKKTRMRAFPSVERPQWKLLTL